MKVKQFLNSKEKERNWMIETKFGMFDPKGDKKTKTLAETGAAAKDKGETKVANESEIKE